MPDTIIHLFNFNTDMLRWDSTIYTPALCTSPSSLTTNEHMLHRLQLMLLPREPQERQD